MSRECFIASITGQPINCWTIASIIAAVARETGIRSRAILSGDRSRDVTAARHEIMSCAYANGRYSVLQNGRAMWRERTFVVNGICRATERKFQ